MWRVCRTLVISSGGAASRHQLFGLHSQLKGRIRKWWRGVRAVGGWRGSVATDIHITHTHRKSSYSGTLTADLSVTNNTMLSSWRSESLTCLLLQTGWVLSALCGRSTDRDKARQDSVILRNNTNTDVRSQGTSRTQREGGWSLTWPIWGSSHSYEKIVLKWNMWFWGKCSFYSYFEVFVKNCLFFLSLSLFVSLLWSHVGGSCRKRVSFFTSLKASTPKNHTKELAATKGDCHIMSHFFFW